MPLNAVKQVRLILMMKLLRIKLLIQQNDTKKSNIVVYIKILKIEDKLFYHLNVT